MKSKLKKIAIPAIMMILINLVLSGNIIWELGIENPHIGLLFVFGLLFGPYGAIGATLGNVIVDLLNGYTPIEILPSAIISFGVSYLAYKLWYSGFKTDKITKPILDNFYHLTLFLSSIVICGIVYSAAHANLIGIFISPYLDQYDYISYFLNFINQAFIFGIIGIWISKRIDLIETPKKSEKPVNNKFYRIVFILLIVFSLVSSVILIFESANDYRAGIVILSGILLFIYLTKPFKYDIQEPSKNTIIEKIVQNFLILTLSIAIIGITVSLLTYNILINFNTHNMYLELMPGIIITDIILILFLIPGTIIMRYVENKVIKPISSFSQIEGVIKENEKIEVEGLIDIYSKYINEPNEIGTLARSYTDLINHSNHYIENIRKIEGEKERINAELDIATKIQASALPTSAIETDEYTVNGYSHPAKEVGGDFFDYYMLDDDNLAIAIGDASGKGVPAALLAMVSQVLIKQMLLHDNDPSKVLYMINNQFCENNPESMFLTLWLGVYNKKTKKLIFSNAGHNPPLIKENNEFRYLDIDSGIVLGVMEEFEYINETITLTDELITYTDGITDANNNENEMYGEDRLLNFFNELKNDSNPIPQLLDNIDEFTEGAEQYDDMTLLFLKIK